MKLICDTNVWYDIGQGRRCSTALKQDGHTLVAHPINLLEIAAGIDGKDFQLRKSACKAICDHADEFFCDTETHLASLWQMERPTNEVPWMEVCETLAGAKKAHDLSQGIVDATSRVRKRVNVPIVQSWKDTRYPEFQKQMDDLIQKIHPTYYAKHASGQPSYMKKEDAKLAKKAFADMRLRETLVSATYERIGGVGAPSATTLKSVTALLEPYIVAYTEYVIDVATQAKPRPNDLGDLECFIYLQNDRRLLTRDKRWIGVAEAGSLKAQWLLDPESTA